MAEGRNPIALCRMEITMPQPERVRSRLQSVDEALARLKARRSRLVARANVSDRKRDTRRKILIGGAVLAAIRLGGVPALATEAQLRGWLDGWLARPHD